MSAAAGSVSAGAGGVPERAMARGCATEPHAVARCAGPKRDVTSVVCDDFTCERREHVPPTKGAVVLPLRDNKARACLRPGEAGPCFDETYSPPPPPPKKAKPKPPPPPPSSSRPSTPQPPPPADGAPPPAH